MLVGTGATGLTGPGVGRYAQRVACTEGKLVFDKTDAVVQGTVPDAELKP